MIQWALNLSTNTRVDQKNRDISWNRMDTDKTVDEVVEMLDESVHFTIKIRRSTPYEPYIDIGFCTMGDKTNYFLWTDVDIKHLHDLKSEFNLKKTL